MRRTRYLLALTVTAAALLLSTPAAHAMINPKFTPIQLVKQAGVVLWVDLKPGESKDLYTATIRETLKGKAEEKTFRLDISRAGEDEAATTMREQLAAGKPALFFVGEFEDTKELGGGNTSRRAFLLLDGVWSVFGGGEQGLWKLNNINDRMLMTVWHGGTDMMRRAVDYILTDDDPKVPVAEGFTFSKGPATVSGWIDKRCLGAWSVLPGVSQACFGRTDAGPVTLKWRLPGGQEQAKEVVLEKGGTLKVEIK